LLSYNTCFLKLYLNFCINFKLYAANPHCRCDKFTNRVNDDNSFHLKKYFLINEQPKIKSVLFKFSVSELCRLCFLPSKQQSNVTLWKSLQIIRIAMATEDVLDLSNTVLRCEPCKICNLTQLQCLLNKISGIFPVHFNTRSLVKNLNKITDWLNSSSIFPDIIDISETKLFGDKHTMVNIKGYSFIHKNSLTNAGGAGLYIKSKLMFREPPDLNINDDNVEDLWVELFSPFKESIKRGTIYFHPNNSVNEFSRNLVNTIIKLNNQKQAFYILGQGWAKSGPRAKCGPPQRFQ